MKRYTRSVQRNLRNSNEKQNLCNGLRYLAWAYCIFFFQGNSQDLFAGSGIRRHASFIINAQRGAEELKQKKNKMKKILLAVCCIMLFVSCQKEEVDNELVGTKWSRQFSSFLHKTSIVLEFTSNTELVYYLMMDDEPSDPKSATYTLSEHNIKFDDLKFTWVNTYTFKNAKYTASVMMVEGNIRDGNGISNLSWNLAKQ